MYKIEVNEERKILFIEFSGYVDNEEALKASHEFKKLTQKGIYQFSIICNISNLQQSTRNARIYLQKHMRELCNLSPNRIIRIINNYNGAMFFDRAHKLSNANYQVQRATSKEHALELIASREKEQFS